MAYRTRILQAKVITRLWHSLLFESIGQGSYIDRPALLLGRANICIGTRTSIGFGARIEAQSRFAGRLPSLAIGSNTNIEQNVHIICQNRVQIGNNVTITGCSAIVDVDHPVDGHDGKIGDAFSDAESEVIIGDGVFIGFGSIVLPNVHIGEGAVVGANSVVSTDVSPFTVVGGVPARVIRERSPRPVGPR